MRRAPYPAPLKGTAEVYFKDHHLATVSYALHVTPGSGGKRGGGKRSVLGTITLIENKTEGRGWVKAYLTLHFPNGWQHNFIVLNPLYPGDTYNIKCI